MGTVASPNLVLTIIDLATGNPDTGETVEILLEGDAYPGDAIALSEIGVTGRYKKEAASGVAAVLQGVYHVYVGGTFNGIFVHGYTAIQTHLDSSADPHAVAAGQVSVVDSGAYYSGSDVEAVLAEIGADLAGKADTANTVLTDSSTQSVDAAKPVVTNLNADKVDGRHAGLGAGNVPILDGSGDLPLANIPDTLTGKDADTVDGKHVGEVAGTIPQITGSTAAGKLDTTMLGRRVGTGNANIPLISTSNPSVAGRIHETLLGTEVGEDDADQIPDNSMARHRTATINQGDSPSPVTYGGGTIWAEISMTDDTDEIIIDTSIDWRDRFIHMGGIVLVQAAAYLPGGANDVSLNGADGSDLDNEANYVSGFFYSEQGNNGSGLPYIMLSLTGEDDIIFYVEETVGDLRIRKTATTNNTIAQIMLKIDYSPDQGHY